MFSVVFTAIISSDVAVHYTTIKDRKGKVAISSVDIIEDTSLSPDGEWNPFVWDSIASQVILEKINLIIGTEI